MKSEVEVLIGKNALLERRMKRRRGRPPLRPRGTVLRDYSAPPTAQEIAQAKSRDEAMAVCLDACARKRGASSGTRRKWMRLALRRSA